MRSPSRRTSSRALAVVAALAWILPGACAPQAPTPAPPPAPAPAAPVASPRVVVVLLPDETGASGSVTVSTAGGTRDIDQPGTAVGVYAAGDAPAQPLSMADAEIQRLFGAALAARPPAPVRFLLYFHEGSDELVPASRALLSDVHRTVRERRAVDVSVIGHTDTVADKRFNYTLGLRRAERVGQFLRAQGLDPAILEIRSHGEEDLLVKTGDGVTEPRNRRVEVTIR